MRNEKGQFQKGNPGKPKGATSQKTSKIREAYQLLIENNLDKLEDDLNQLKPKERLEMIINLSSFVLPKLKATDMRIKEEWDKVEQPLFPDDIRKIERVIISPEGIKESL